MKRYVDESGTEWTVIGNYQLAVIDGQVVVKAAPGEDDATALAEFGKDLSVLESAGLIVTSSVAEDGQ